jgi:hypothetical protein
MERGIERSLVHLQDVARQLLDALRNRPAMLRLEQERLQDEEIERALDEVDGLNGRSI